MSIRLKRPGVCVICSNAINPVMVQINPAVDCCGKMCSMAIQRMSIPARIAMIRDKFEASPELEDAIARLEHEAKMLEGMERMMNDPMNMSDKEPVDPSDYMRPMGAPPVEPSPVFKPMKPSSSIFIAGETDEEVAKNVLLVCWGTAAK